MGKIIYEPNKSLNKVTNKPTSKKEKESQDAQEKYNALVENIDSVRPVGDTECEYVIYLEDYVYTYIYQYAATDLEYEHSAMIIGEYYKDTKEMIICGVMPIPKEKLSKENEWINQEVIRELNEEKEKYFKDIPVLGWMHMQPGYGNMLTMKEVKVHRDLFDRQATLLLLVDPINKLENFYVYEESDLKEQSGYYIYYDKNPCMQQYMLEHPFIIQEKEQKEDKVVNQFRAMGKQRKKEYEQKKRLNFTVAASALTILAMSAVVVKMNDQRNEIRQLQNNLAKVEKGKMDNTTTFNGDGGNSEDISFIIDSNETSKAQEVNEQTVEANSDMVIVQENIDEVKEDDKDQIVQIEQDPMQKENVAQQAIESTKENKDLAASTIEQATKENKEEAVKEEAVKEEAVKEEVVKGDEQEVANAQDEYTEYTVKEGDTLLKISYKYYQTEKRAKDIIKINQIDNGDTIFVGQKLKIPAK